MYCVTGGRRNKHRSTEDYVHSMYRAGYTLELGGNHHYHHAQQYTTQTRPQGDGHTHEDISDAAAASSEKGAAEKNDGGSRKDLLL